MNILPLPLGTRVRSRRDEKIVGTIQGFGTLFVPSWAVLDQPVTVYVYLVWPEGMAGSSSLGTCVRALDSEQVEVIE